MNCDLRLYESIKYAGINLILSVPCKMLQGIIDIINLKKDIHHIPLTREEEGVGIAAGAFMAGKVPALLMQNSGIGNSINAIKSLLELYEIPIIFILSHRGAKGEKISAQIPMGQITFKLLDCININYLVLDTIEKIEKLPPFIKKGLENNRSIAVVLERSLWEV
ncbi:MAG: sulfopyruvate decarboxylase subunit alpha [Candidatus Lokiarchaeota archaeon]